MTAEPSQLLPREAYLGAPDGVSRMLLGKLLVSRGKGSGLGSKTLVGRIVETEAYFGVDDPAAHSAAGRTARTAVIFGPPGHAYVYLIYGMYSCLNVTCEPEGLAGCVLIRALEPLAGLPEMARNRGLPPNSRPSALTAGPGRLCQAFAITRAEHNGIDLASPASALQIRDDGFIPEDIAVSPRVGITKAAERLLRFTVAGHTCLSRPAG